MKLNMKFIRFAPWFGAPVHGVYFGQMASKCPSGTHLNAPNWFHRTSSLSQCCVTGCFSSILLVFGKVHKTTFIIIESTHRHFCTRLSLIKTISKVNVLGTSHNIYLGWYWFILQVERSPKLIIWCKYYDLHLLKDYSFITYAYCIF